jgi:oligopeptide/dipeptide ABC transporter ATP-binding protein
MGLMPAGVARIEAGRIVLAGQDVTGFSEREWEGVRGRPVAIVFQDPLSFLNPVMTAGAQIAESVRRHERGVDVAARCQELLGLVALPAETMRRYPHELSGGMRQRVILAIALGCRPTLLVADEPTTALDVTTQAEIMALLGDLRRRLGMGLLLISHDLGLLRWHCDRVFVMYGGRTVEWGTTAAVLGGPLHPYAQGLIAASRLVRGADGRFGALRGDVTAAGGEGCPFVGRCPAAMVVCAEAMPPAFGVGRGGPPAFAGHAAPPAFAGHAAPPAFTGHAARCWLLDPAVAAA